ncbi:hypothetical protein E4U54_006231, partial [Claviceps lovelessii]
MHQQPRPPLRLPASSASSASSPQSPQARNTNPRDVAAASRQRAGSNVSGRESVPSPIVDRPFTPGMGLPADSIKKLDQIVQ